ncbi:MAG: hypothetical protein AAF681_14860, partial [Pseudomonadota bacterium]
MPSTDVVIADVEVKFPRLVSATIPRIVGRVPFTVIPGTRAKVSRKSVSPLFCRSSPETTTAL